MVEEYGAWVCTTCGERIAATDGLIELINQDPDLGEIGRYPVPPRTGGEDHEPQSRAEIFDQLERELLHGPRIGVQVYHAGKCDPNPENQGYWFETARAATLEEWCAWVIHLAEKTWMDKDDLARMLNYWWQNRGIERPSP